MTAPGLYIGGLLHIVYSTMVILAVATLLIKDRWTRKRFAFLFACVSLFLLVLAVWNLTFYLDHIELDYRTVDRFYWIVISVVALAFSAFNFWSSRKTSPSSAEEPSVGPDQ